MKKPEPHSQYTLETCGICCLLMAQQALGLGYATAAKQTAYYRDYGAKATPGTLGSTIAYVLFMKGIAADKEINVKIVHAPEKLLENRGENGLPYFPQEKFEAILAEHKRWLDDAEKLKNVKNRPADSFECVVGKPFGCAQLRQELDSGRLVILQILVEGDYGAHDKVMHWILLYGHEDGVFRAIDPMPKPVGGRIRISEEELAEHMETPFGGCYISVGER